MITEPLVKRRSQVRENAGVHLDPKDIVKVEKDELEFAKDRDHCVVRCADGGAQIDIDCLADLSREDLTPFAHPLLVTHSR